jgi:anti-sigma factor RsiW
MDWPREIWAAELGEFEPVGDYVCSEHATVARYEGDKERGRIFHRYVDGDIHDSQERYFKAMLESEREARAKLNAAFVKKDQAMTTLFRLLEEHDVDYSHLVS